MSQKWGRIELSGRELILIEQQVAMAQNVSTLDLAIKRLEVIMKGDDLPRAEMARLIHDKVLKLKAGCDDQA